MLRGEPLICMRCFPKYEVFWGSLRKGIDFRREQDKAKRAREAQRNGHDVRLASKLFV